MVHRRGIVALGPVDGLAVLEPPRRIRLGAIDETGDDRGVVDLDQGPDRRDEQPRPPLLGLADSEAHHDGDEHDHHHNLQGVDADAVAEVAGDLEALVELICDGGVLERLDVSTQQVVGDVDGEERHQDRDHHVPQPTIATARGVLGMPVAQRLQSGQVPAAQVQHGDDGKEVAQRHQRQQHQPEPADVVARRHRAPVRGATHGNAEQGNGQQHRPVSGEKLRGVGEDGDAVAHAAAQTLVLRHPLPP